jgi:hypothetical protein
MPTPRPNLHPNREAWLNDVAQRLRRAFADLGAPLPDRLRIAIGFPSSGRRAKATGECWDSTASADGTFEILVRPDLAEAEGALALPVATACARLRTRPRCRRHQGRQRSRLPQGCPRHRSHRPDARHHPRAGLPRSDHTHPGSCWSPPPCQAPRQSCAEPDGSRRRHRAAHHRPATAKQSARQMRLPHLRIHHPHRARLARSPWPTSLPPARRYAARGVRHRHDDAQRRGLGAAAGVQTHTAKVKHPAG